MPDTLPLNETNIAILGNNFYAKVREDALLGPVFNGAIGDHWPGHLATLTNFWTSVLLASGRYKGNPMMAHLAITQMDKRHFNQWIKLWSATTTEIFGPQTSAALIAKASTMGERLVAVSTRVRETQPQA